MNKLADIVKQTSQMARAQKMILAHAAGMLPVRPSVLPELTDQECAMLALKTDYSYEAIRRAFDHRHDNQG